jgi:PAS domain S-box-containing protein
MAADSRPAGSVNQLASFTGQTAHPPPDMPQSSATVLVVDDNAGKRLALRAILAPLGYSIVEADSGVACLRCISVQDFAVILLDVRMPTMDGFETAALIRLRRESEMTPIIFVTALRDDETVAANRYRQGAVDFITAPVQPDELRAKVSVFANLFLKAAGLAEQARAVQASADQLRLLTEAAPIGIFQTDADNRYVYTNPRWAEVTGHEPGAAIGEPWDVVFDSRSRAEVQTKLIEASANGGEFSHRFEIALPDDPSRFLRLTSRCIRGPDGVATGWVGTLADITAVTKAEVAMANARDEANASSQLKSDFLANMSHEIRTPMNGVLGMTDLLLETDLDAVQRDYAETVRVSGDALLTVINDILDFSKIETGKLEIEDIDFSVETTVHDVVHLLKPSAQAKGLDLSAIVEDSVPVVATGDPGRVRQVLTNLIGNAIKFTDSGGIVIRVTSDGVAEDGEIGPGLLVRFEVADSGVGIAAEKQATIFDAFVQADMSTSRKYGGTGLGLAISRQLAELMGGHVGLHSQHDSGSTFWFTVLVHPRTQADTPPEDDADTTVPDVDDVAPVRDAGRLLLAEDNLVNQKVALAMLSIAGYQVDTVLDGAEAVKAAAAQHYDAILMDCQMPVLSGYKATAAIRALEGPERHTPIIALTAGARREDRERSMAAGMDFYVSKPINKDALLNMVRRSLAAPVSSGRTAFAMQGHPRAG